MKLTIQPEAGVVPIIQAIKTARKSIDVFIFRFDRNDVEKALESVAKRGSASWSSACWRTACWSRAAPMIYCDITPST